MEYGAMNREGLSKMCTQIKTGAQWLIADDIYK